jgi:hypothetical protein
MPLGHETIRRHLSEAHQRVSAAVKSARAGRPVHGGLARMLGFNSFTPMRPFLAQQPTPMRRLLLLSLLLAWAPLQARTFTNTQGARIEGEVVKVDGSQVTMLLAGGRTITFAVSLLSQPDQDYLRGWNSKAATDGGIYIAVGNGLHRMSSPDGITWSHHQFVGKPGHDQNDLKSLAAGNGAVVAVGGFSKSNILTTRDGVEWQINDFNAGVLSGVIFVNEAFHAFGEGGKVIRSKEGLKWEVIGDAKTREYLATEAQKLGESAPIKSNIRDWRHMGGRFVGSGDNGFLITTTDFQKWEYPPRIEPRSRLYIETNGAGFVVVGEATLHHSPDGLKWTEVTPKIPEGTKFGSLVFDGRRYLVNTRKGAGFESADGTEWKEVKNASFPGTLAAVRPDLIYAFATYRQPTEKLQYSTDGGKSWKSATLPAPAGITRVIHARFLSAPAK